MPSNTNIDFIQQQQLIKKYDHYKSQPSEQIFANTYILKKIRNVRILDVNMKLKKVKCPACTYCLKKNHFLPVCKYKKKNIERVEENETNVEVYSVKKTKTRL